MIRTAIVPAIAAGSLAGVAPSVAAAASVWLLPSVFAALAEREPARPMTRAMALFGAAAAFAPLAALWSAGGGMDAGWAAASQPDALALAWSAQAMAWLLAQLIPAALAIHADWTGGRELRRLEAALARLQEEWQAP